MILVAIAWLYVVLMMAVAEALSTQGTLLGAVVTFVFYGLLPLSVVLYIMGTPRRRRARLRVERAQQDSQVNAADAASGPSPPGPRDAASAAEGEATP